MNNVLSPYSAVLLASYGGPCQPEDVLLSMHNATAGRDMSDERLLKVSQHYQLFGGRSPIDKQNEALHDALAAELKKRGCPRPVVIGDRNWAPFFAETISALRRNCHDRMVALITAMYSYYSVCRQYREDLAAAMEQIPDVVIDKVGPYSERDGFISVSVDALAASVQALWPRIGDGVMKMLFVAHSIPVAMSAVFANGTPVTRYDAQHIRATSRMAEATEAYLGERLGWELVHCSRSGSPHISWLEPDVNGRLAELTGVASVVAAPIGFVSDYMEVVYDLGTQARKLAVATGFDYERIATASIHPGFIATLADLLLKQAAVARGELAPPDHPCLTEPASCCLPHP